MKTYSVAELAEQTARDGEDLRAVGDRIRNWTREGLLVPVGSKNPGTGRSRRYPETSLFDAVVLTAITEAVGLQIVRVHEFSKELFGILRKVPNSKGALLVISRDRKSSSRISLEGPETLARAILRGRSDAHIVIDLTRLLI